MISSIYSDCRVVEMLTDVRSTFLLAIIGCLVSYISFDLSRTWLLKSLINAPSVEDLVEQGTSVICQGRKHTNRQCRFHNLCFIPNHQSFAYLHSNKSKYLNLPIDPNDPALLDLSSVEDHNQHYFHYVDIPSESIEDFDAEIDARVTLVLNRFLPSNLMHAIHDDIIPAYHQMEKIASEHSIEKTDIQLLFMDDMPDHEFEILYTALSDFKPLTKIFLRQRNKTVCYQNIHLGLAENTLWYQYGFRTFQGRLPIALDMSPKFFPEFRKFMISQMNMNVAKSGGDYMVLLTRKDNRLIVNEMELMIRLSRLLKIVVVSLETFSVEETIQYVSSAKGLIGMHGSLLSLAVFLPNDSVLIELFPYAIPPENYAPYRAISELPGLRLSYRSWSNNYYQNTITHPDWDPIFGGIHHLPENERLQVENNRFVPKHLCCNDPNWLYRIYQDTIVSVDEIMELTVEALNEAKMPKRTIMLPAQVMPIECDNNRITWYEPWNLQYIVQPEDKVQYQVWLKNSVSGDHETHSTDDLFLLVEGLLSSSVNYSIWIRCQVNDVMSPFSGQKSCTFSNMGREGK